MPYHVYTARHDPARTILWVVALLTLLAQAAALCLSWPYGLINFVLVAPVAIWGLWSAKRDNHKHMARSSFWLSAMWIWSGLTRLIVVGGAGELLWIPFLVVGAAMGICYLRFSYLRRNKGAVIPDNAFRRVRNGGID